MTSGCRHLRSLSGDLFRKFLNSFDVVLSDCDGVLWKEEELIKGSPEAVRKFRELGKTFFYLTNASCRTRAELASKCNRLDYAATAEDILCSSYLTAVYLKTMNFKKKVYIVGGEGISKELNEQSIKNFGVGPDPMDNPLDTILKFKPDREVGAVVVGVDNHFNYAKLIKAATYARDPRVHFIGTNPDIERPSPNDNVFPDAGCFLSAIEHVVGRRAFVVGKPEPFVTHYLRNIYGVNPARTLMIGDNPKTDILLGKRSGYQTLLVLSGITTPGKYKELTEGNEESLVPDYFTDQLSDILECLEK